MVAAAVTATVTTVCVPFCSVDLVKLISVIDHHHHYQCELFTFLSFLRTVRTVSHVSYRALVLYNAALVAAGAHGVPLLLVYDQQLAPWAHSPQARAVLALPGRNVFFVRGAITPAQVEQHRPSYINAILIQSRGEVVPGGCSNCRISPGYRPFPECRRVPGHFGGCCGNCKWRDHAVRCSAQDDNTVVLDSSSSDDDSSSDDGAPGHGDGGGQLVVAGSTAATAIVVS